jgi:hypothetical protein
MNLGSSHLVTANWGACLGGVIMIVSLLLLQIGGRRQVGLGRLAEQ